MLTILLTGLLIFRINLLVQSYREAVHREQVLREINAGLMRAADLSEVNGRLSDWASRLVEQPEVTCVLGTAEELASVGSVPLVADFGCLTAPSATEQSCRSLAVSQPVASWLTPRKLSLPQHKLRSPSLAKALVWRWNDSRSRVVSSSVRRPNAFNSCFTTLVTSSHWSMLKAGSAT